MSDKFELVMDDWQSNGEWMYADKKAERKFFFAAGQLSSVNRIAELETQLKGKDQVIFSQQRVIAELEAALKEGEPILLQAADKIEELEADCKVMAEEITHNVTLYTRSIDIIATCACPACTIAAKYRG